MFQIQVENTENVLQVDFANSDVRIQTATNYKKYGELEVFMKLGLSMVHQNCLQRDLKSVTSTLKIHLFINIYLFNLLIIHLSAYSSTCRILS